MMVSVFLILLLPVAAVSVPVGHISLQEDCEDVYTNGSIHSGIYTVCPSELANPIQVYCDMDCEDDEDKGGWTVFQRRMDGTANFYRPWSHYKHGFGDISGEYWLGLENLYAMTWTKKYRLRVDMEDFEGGAVHAEYESFSVESESDGYRLRLGRYIDGGAGDAMRYVNGRMFSTFDREQYGRSYYYGYYYAEKCNGGFWYGYSYYNYNGSPNGLYKWGRHTYSGTGMTWRTWKGSSYSLKSISMKIRPATLEHANNANNNNNYGYYVTPGY